MREKRLRFAERVKSAIDVWRDDLVQRIKDDEGFSLLVQKHWLLLVSKKMDGEGRVVESQVGPLADGACMVAAGVRAIKETDEG